MAQQKKSTGKRTASKKPSKAAVQEKRFVRRDVGGVICVVLAFLFVLSWFIQAVVLNFFRTAGTGLFGFGYYILPLGLLIAAFILFFRKGTPTTARVLCALLLGPFGGMFGHLCRNTATSYAFSFKMLVPLWKDGITLLSGGLISGFFASAFSIAISRAGAFVLVIAAFLLCLMAAINVPFSVFGRFFKWIFKKREPRVKPKKERVDEDTQEDIAGYPVSEEPTSTLKKKIFFDIPLDENGASPPTPRRAAVPPEPLPLDPEPIHKQAPVPPAATAVAGSIVQPPIAKQAQSAEDRKAAEQVARLIDKNLNESETPPYQFPPIDLLSPGGASSPESGEEMKQTMRRLNETLTSFMIAAQIVSATRGPSVTRYEVVLDKGIKLSKLTGLSDDLALSLGTSGVRIAPIPNKISMVGIEVPNKSVSTVKLRDLLDSKEFRNATSKLSFAVGKNIGGENIIGNISRLPHMLIAGTTGSGKSVCMNSIIISLLYKATPDEVRLIMIDPKMVELGLYNGIPHLLVPVVTDPKKASGALQWAVVEMMKRYKLFSESGARDISGYNLMCEKTGTADKIPQIVVVIDELADLMLIAAKEVEESICRVAQMGRASGIHLVIATQRPSADVITGLMKANIPSRIALVVANALESRIILDNQGAEKLVGNGDMLYLPLGAGKPTRIQGTFITDQEREDVIAFVKKSGDTSYNDEVIAHMEKAAVEKHSGKDTSSAASNQEEDDCDELMPAAVDVIMETGQASVSMLQRRLKLGYSRAARLVDQMEDRGIVGPFEGSKPRQTLITKEQWQVMKAKGTYSGHQVDSEQQVLNVAPVEELDPQTETYD